MCWPLATAGGCVRRQQQQWSSWQPTTQAHAGALLAAPQTYMHVIVSSRSAAVGHVRCHGLLSISPGLGEILRNKFSVVVPRRMRASGGCAGCACVAVVCRDLAGLGALPALLDMLDAANSSSTRRAAARALGHLSDDAVMLVHMADAGKQDDNTCWWRNCSSCPNSERAPVVFAHSVWFLRIAYKLSQGQQLRWCRLAQTAVQAAVACI
jgi:hypothetical protein